MNNTTKEFKKFIKSLRDERIKQGKTQQSIAKKAKISQSTVNFYERGLIEPTVTNFIKWTKELGYKVIITKE